MSAVLRLRAGDRVVLFDGDGFDYPAVVELLSRPEATVTIEGRELAAAFPPPEITLAVSLIKPERFEWMLQKSTELGVAAIVPMECDRSVVSLQTGRAKHRSERWRRIVIEAAEQCGRATIPRLDDPLPFASVLQAARGAPAVLLWEDERRTALAGHLRRFGVPSWLLVGPEGGFSAAEIALARSAGLGFASLGPLILRTETAAVAALASIRALTLDDDVDESEGSLAS